MGGTANPAGPHTGRCPDFPLMSPDTDLQKLTYTCGLSSAEGPRSELNPNIHKLTHLALCVDTVWSLSFPICEMGSPQSSWQDDVGTAQKVVAVV